MDKKDVAKWQRRIEDTFAGPAGIVGESIFKLEERDNSGLRRTGWTGEWSKWYLKKNMK